MTVARIKEIQALTSYPESISIQQALLQVWNECAQEYHKEQLILSGVSQRSELLNFMEHLSMYHNIDEVIDCTKYQQIIEQYKV